MGRASASMMLPLELGPKPKRHRGTTSRKAMREAVIARQFGRCFTCERDGLKLDVKELRPGVRIAQCRACRRTWDAKSRR